MIFDVETTDKSSPLARPDRSLKGSWRQDIVNNIKTPPRPFSRALPASAPLRIAQKYTWQAYLDSSIPPPACNLIEGDCSKSLEIPMSTTILARRGSTIVLEVSNVRSDAYCRQTVLEAHPVTQSECRIPNCLCHHTSSMTHEIFPSL